MTETGVNEPNTTTNLRSECAREHGRPPGSDHDPVAGARCRPLAQGDPAPLCIGVSIANMFYSFLGQAGRPVALILAASVGMPELPAFVRAFASHLDEAARLDSDIVLVINGDPLGTLAYNRRQPTTVPIVICMNNFFERCGLPQNQPVVLVLDRNLRVAGIIADAEAARAAVRAIACLAALPRERPREVTLPAPVLFLPNLIERELCRGLIERFESGGNYESGYTTKGPDGAPALQDRPQQEAAARPFARPSRSDVS
jgi:hypothetical protein